jgi:hypothetical protein
MYIFGYMDRTSPPRGRTYTHGPAQSECLHVCASRARIGGAAAHNRPRRIEARPSASAKVRAAGPGAAHTEPNEVTRAVFHAPMFALNADAEENACAPKPHAGHVDGQGLARFMVSGFRPSPQHEPANACAHSRSITIAHWCTHTSPRPILTYTDEWIM